jgi:hypothetical protein
MTSLTIPDLCDPQGIYIAWVPGYNVTQTARHLANAPKKDLDQFVTPPWDGIQLADQSIHLLFSIAHVGKFTSDLGQPVFQLAAAPCVEPLDRP